MAVLPVLLQSSPVFSLGLFEKPTAGKAEASGSIKWPAAHCVDEAELAAQQVRSRRVRLRLQPPQLVRDGRPALLLDLLLL